MGLVQLSKYNEIVLRRQELAKYYDRFLSAESRLELSPIVKNATYSHYVVRVSDRQMMLRLLREQGIQLGEVIQYSIPYLKAYSKYSENEKFPNSELCSESVVNLPLYVDLVGSELCKIKNGLAILNTGTK